jgi:trimethylamine--corrinoid protein Co-methyltransferase
MKPISKKLAKRRGRRSKEELVDNSSRPVNYRQLRSPFPTMDVFSLDEIANIHATALRTLEELGIKVLHREARSFYAKAGARVDEKVSCRSSSNCPKID